MNGKHILIDLETKTVTGIKVHEHTYESRCCYYGTPVQETVIKGKSFNPTDLTKEERDTFKKVTDELLSVYNKQTLDEEVWKQCNIFRNALGYGPIVVCNPEMYKVVEYAKADVKLVESIYKGTNPSLDKIYINPDKEIVTAKKDNDEIIKVQTGKGDEFDPYIGAALAYCYKQFGSKAAFRKAVDKITPKPKKKKKVVVPKK